MSVIIGNTDITRYINQGGISESTKKVYTSDGTVPDEEAESKGVHCVFSLNARMPSAVKDFIGECIKKNAVTCTVDEMPFSAEVTDFSASVFFEFGDICLWNVSFTISDVDLSEENTG